MTIDVDGMDPAIMPATGTPEPGGLSWYEILALLRATMATPHGRRLRCRRTQSASRPDGPNFLCAKLVYKILTYRFRGSDFFGSWLLAASFWREA